MKKKQFIWIIQSSGEKHYNWVQLRKAAAELNSGAIYVPLNEIENFAPPYKFRPIIIGGDDFIEKANKNPPLKDGIFLCDSFFRVDSYVNLFGDKYLNSDTKYISAKEAVSKKITGFFARPLYDNKCFDGGIIGSDSKTKEIFKRCKSCQHYEEKCICISSMKRITAEWRTVIISGKISAICRYLPKRDGENISAALIEFCNKCISKAPDLAAWVMDIAESNGNYYVLECNVFNASNFYSCNRHKIVEDLEKSLSHKAP